MRRRSDPKPRSDSDEGISFGVLLSFHMMLLFLQEDTKRSSEIPRALRTHAFAYSLRSIRKSSTTASPPLRMTDRGIVRRLTRGSPSGGAPAKRVRGEEKALSVTLTRATSPTGERLIFLSPGRANTIRPYSSSCGAGFHRGAISSTEGGFLPSVGTADRISLRAKRAPPALLRIFCGILPIFIRKK